ncbi:hypothetical protein [Nocardia arizonensis]|uniref:hypothetical protein n=1 Tax=Nocardia arizonensis TaxID=1141647 RepID=UPI0006CFBE01|nr:hypothetical protein [Nocardia arizonensis]
MCTDPTVINPDLYRVIFENERVRVLEYRDHPGDRTRPHTHPDSILYPLTSFRRRISSGGQQVEVELTRGQIRWVAAQEHAGENIGDTETHALFIELKEPPPTPSTPTLGPNSA